MLESRTTIGGNGAFPPEFQDFNFSKLKFNDLRLEAFLIEMEEYDVTNIAELAEIVKLGYQTAAIEYRGQKDSSILNLPIFQLWLSHIPLDGVIVELGCGSGYPIANHIASISKGMSTNQVFLKSEIGSQLKYIGVDISDEQIQIARENLKGSHFFRNIIERSGHEDNISFVVQEMLEWCRKQPDNSLHAFICLFSVFHLPRTFHVEFFQHVQRICKPSAPILFTIPQNPCEGFEDSWLGVRVPL